MASPLSTPFICAGLPRGPRRAGDAGRKARRG